MLKCELCGADIRGRAYKAIIDRSEMIVCSRCSKNGTIIGVLELSTPKRNYWKSRNIPRKPRRRQEVVEEIVEDYAQRIREARERMGLTRELLAAMIKEKTSTIRRIESGTLQPTIELAKRLERVLKIKLVEEFLEEDFEEYRGSTGDYELTLGDIAEFKE